MRIFVTGATGFVGSAIVQDLLAAGHHVAGLARSDASAAKLSDAGADVVLGSLEDLDGLQKAAADSKGSSILRTTTTSPMSGAILLLLKTLLRSRPWVPH